VGGWVCVCVRSQGGLRLTEAGSARVVAHVCACRAQSSRIIARMSPLHLHSRPFSPVACLCMPVASIPARMAPMTCDALSCLHERRILHVCLPHPS